MPIGTFAMIGMQAAFSNNHAAREAGNKAAATAGKVSEIQRTLRMLQENLAKALMINEALWELIKEKHNLSDNDLNEKLYMVDMRDGQLDGKNQRTSAAKCHQCHRMVSHRHAACIYCGTVIDDSIFSLT